MDSRPDEERRYLLKRGAQHRAMASRTDDAGARDLHLRFADAYDRRAATLVDQD